MANPIVASMIADFRSDGTITYRPIGNTSKGPKKATKTHRYTQETIDWARSRIKSGARKVEVVKEIGCAYGTLDGWLGKRRSRSSN